MNSSELVLDSGPFGISPLGYEPRTHRVLHNWFEVATQSSVIPRTVLVDQDKGFVKAISRIAKRFEIPFQSYLSISEIEMHRRPIYDLVLLDEKTIGKDRLLEAAMKMTSMIGDVAIVLIGEEEPTESEMDKWSPLIQRFLFKDWDTEGVEVLFRDAVQIFANSNTTGNRRVKYLGN